MTISLEHYEDASFIKLYNNTEYIGSIIYKRNIHKHESESDFYNLKLQNNTYSDKVVIELFNYYKRTRK